VIIYSDFLNLVTSRPSTLDERVVEAMLSSPTPSRKRGVDFVATWGVGSTLAFASGITRRNFSTSRAMHRW